LRCEVWSFFDMPTYDLKVAPALNAGTLALAILSVSPV